MEYSKMTAEEKENVIRRNMEIIELIKMDPNNRAIYSEELIVNNLPLVGVICRKYKPYTEDQFQTGCIGLIQAARYYDPTKKVPFASYACSCIENAIISSHQNDQDWFDTAFRNGGGAIVSLDDLAFCSQDDQVQTADLIADELASMDFMKMLDEFQLSRIFDEIIIPILDRYVASTNGTRTYNAQLWKKLEMSLLLEMVEIDPIYGGITLAKMARMLGLSTTCIKNKHTSILDKIRKELHQSAYISN